MAGEVKSDAATVPVKRRRLTAGEFHHMTKVGILPEDDTVELLDGQLFERERKTPRHAACVNRLLRRFIDLTHGRAIVSIQNPVRLSRYTELYPDCALLRSDVLRGGARLPRPADVLLLIEVVDASFAYDRDLKLPCYAATAIPDTWLIDLPHRSLEVHREPRGGRYQQVTIVREGQTVSPLAFPDVVVAMSDILP